jgi:hypothetical protein
LESVSSAVPFLGIFSMMLIFYSLVKTRRPENPDLSLLFSFIGCLFGFFGYLLHFAYYFEMYTPPVSLLLLLLGSALFLFWYKKLRNL